MKWLTIILTLGVLIMFGKDSQARGIRNNNPGNIRHSSAQWDGMRLTQSDSAFVQFTSPVYGLRALAKLLFNYQRLYGINTVRGIISRWAPSSENNTEAYIFVVANALNVHPDGPLDMRSAMPELVAAIVKHENGAQPYSLAMIGDGIALAVA
ncbi:MAG: hypothetical protein COB30_015305 [Ectothiorhodospiraceae bacterium]|nr:hypothetical protein [Ectothiorhodospiraceae bacterium]